MGRGDDAIAAVVAFGARVYMWMCVGIARVCLRGGARAICGKRTRDGARVGWGWGGCELMRDTDADVS